MKTEQFTPKGYTGSIVVKRLTFDEKTDFQEEMSQIHEDNKEGTKGGFKVIRKGKEKLFKEMIVSVDLVHTETGREVKSKEDLEYETNAVTETVMTVLIGASGEEKKLAEGNDVAK